MLRYSEVSKRYGGAEVIGGVSLSVETGSTVALIGASGSGKSTLLRMAVGLVEPDSGGVEVEGVSVGSDVRGARDRVGYVIQEGGLLPHLPAAENASLKARDAGWDPGRIRDRVRQLAELAHLPTDALSRVPGELSGGQRQRVALMRGLMMDPGVLLLDEPLGALDPVIRHGLQNELKSIFDRLGKTVLLVTHDVSEAAYFTDDLVLLAGGRVLQRGPLSALVGEPASDEVTAFVRSNRADVLANAGVA